MVKVIITISIFMMITIGACEKQNLPNETISTVESPSVVEHQQSTETPVTEEDSPGSPTASTTEEAIIQEELIEEVVVGGSIEMPRLGVISKYDKIVRKYARRYLFDWRLISAQIYAESTFRHTAKSSFGALGLMQIMPSTAQWLEEKAAKDTQELKDVSQTLLEPEANIHLGCYYNAMLLGKIENAENSEEQYKMMFAAYNAGFGNLSKARRRSSAPGNWEGIKPYLPRETRYYIPKIYKKYEEYKKWSALIPY
ncbi:transglycosylase SLT domain-containing protein [bacterium]|nr:transglycosylase SLT domain-containing protein [bacterium]